MKKYLRQYKNEEPLYIKLYKREKTMAEKNTIKSDKRRRREEDEGKEDKERSLGPSSERDCKEKWVWSYKGCFKVHIKKSNNLGHFEHKNQESNVF